MASPKKFFSDVYKEMKKVRWPKKKEMLKYSLAVISCIVILSIFFAFSDIIIAGFKTLLEAL